jgi:hypothetical protein
MDLPGLNTRTGKVVEAEIRRRFGLPVSFDPALPSREFFLVLSFGRCKFRLTEAVAAALLQSVIGGIVENFRILPLGDRVFRFSVSSQAVGFHVYKLRSFECSLFKLYFNLWHGGGANYMSEFRRWQHDEAAEWTMVGKKKQSSSSIGVEMEPTICSC